MLKVETPFVDGGSTKTPTTTFEYDLVGNQVTVMDPLRNASPATDYTSKTVYDLNHRPTAVTDAAGYTSKTVYDADGLVTAEINQAGNTKKTDYDGAGQPVAIHVPHTPIGGHQEDRVTTLAYDQAGNVTRQTRPSGRYSETVYDKNNRPVQNKSAFDTATTLYKTPSSTFIQYFPTGEIKAQSEPTFGSSGLELQDGVRTEGKYHAEDVLQLTRRYSQILEDDRKAGNTILTSSERDLARSEFRENWTVLNTPDANGAVTADLEKRGALLEIDRTVKNIQTVYAVNDITSVRFEERSLLRCLDRSRIKLPFSVVVCLERGRSWTRIFCSSRFGKHGISSLHRTMPALLHFPVYMWGRARTVSFVDE
ncbi:YD repeat-containing protein [Kribbella sp. VKM Ac-2569]|uniref:RHS repeat protein n=1 Tax=Kribbella sp. VKM Ac-2569 TaxID=2512220 RepID=UPI00102C9835|nr:RHS repeat protein [Kribbella sp. VKM Ac-2569]RZT11691.1 YD repeat-containing protein [Kribbella sp. VKM Ac-2569]